MLEIIILCELYSCPCVCSCRKCVVPGVAGEVQSAGSVCTGRAQSDSSAAGDSWDPPAGALTHTRTYLSLPGPRLTPTRRMKHKSTLHPCSMYNICTYSYNGDTKK